MIPSLILSFWQTFAEIQPIAPVSSPALVQEWQHSGVNSVYTQLQTNAPSEFPGFHLGQANYQLYELPSNAGSPGAETVVAVVRISEGSLNNSWIESLWVKAESRWTEIPFSKLLSRDLKVRQAVPCDTWHCALSPTPFTLKRGIVNIEYRSDDMGHLETSRYFLWHGHLYST